MGLFCRWVKGVFKCFLECLHMDKPFLASFLLKPRLVHLMLWVLDTPNFFQEDGNSFFCDKHLLNMSLL